MRQIIGWITLVTGITMITAEEIIKLNTGKKKVIWFKAPSLFVNYLLLICKYFLKLIEKHFNGNNLIKISYLCTSNSYKIISNHNKNLIEKSSIDRQGWTKPLCNCWVREECPVGGKCNSENVVYKATIFTMENRKDIKTYFRISAGNWKQRLFSHRHSSLRNQTVLSKWFWRLNDSGLTPLVRWNFIKRSTTPSNFRSRCNLCLEENISIIKYRNTSKVLNQRNELIFKCCYKDIS